MSGQQPARRYPAAEFPEIRGVRLVPLGAAASLVNLSATGVLVECAGRAAPGTPMTVQFEGRFRPSSVESRVIRCEVRGIAGDGTLRFHIGLAFNAKVQLRQDEHEDEANLAPAGAPAAESPAGALQAETAAPAMPAGVVVPTPAAWSAPPVPRNRW